MNRELRVVLWDARPALKVAAVVGVLAVVTAAAIVIAEPATAEASTLIQVPDLRPSNLPHYPTRAEALRTDQQPWDPTGRMALAGYGMFLQRWLMFGWMLWQAVGPT